MRVFLLTAILMVFSLAAFAQGEQAPILEKEVAYKDWTYKNLNGEGETNLRQFTGGKKLVLVVYFAPWCPNWRHEAPFVQKMHEKYGDKGLGVIGVGEYDPLESMRKNISDLKITFPVVYESDTRQAKLNTPHFQYRRATGDIRNWGSPWNIFLEPAKLEKKGDVLTNKTYIVNGELIEKEAEAFIREKLGLPKDEGTTAAKENPVEPCPPTVELKKP